MTQLNLAEASIDTLQEQMNRGVLTAAALVNDCQRRIQRYDPDLNAVQVLNAQALDIAQALDVERQQSGPRSALHGIPVLVKDNYETIDVPTTAGSALFQGYQSASDATLVARLRAAGAVIIGKTTMHEFAYGITTVGSAFGSARNPYHLEHNPGGSSGGSGAAVAAGFATVAMGTDTCGSIRIPAAHNNLVGLRGTQGLSSRYGIVPLSSTQDIGGPLARCVADLATVLDLTVGCDRKDRQTMESLGRIPLSYRESLRSKREARIGLLPSFFVAEAADRAVAQVVRQALSALVDAAQWQLTEVDDAEVATALDRPLNGHLVLISDFKTDINAYLRERPNIGIRDLDAIIAHGGTHPDIADSLAASAASDSSHLLYHQERAQRAVLRQALLTLLHEHELDALAYPTIRQTAAPLGAPQFGTNCRLSANSGLPAISVPAGFVNGLPVGLELLSEAWSEQKLLDLAHTVESEKPQWRPPFD